jgi:cytochrome c-type biogenesis protein CcmH
MLWIIFAALTGLAVFSILWPLAGTPRTESRGAAEGAFYRAQIAEIDRDARQGLVTAEDAEGAKAEAARRFIAVAEKAGKEEPAPLARSGRLARIASIAALIFVPAFALGLYHLTGNPALPDQPLSARLQNPPNSGPDHAELIAAIEKIESHLAQHPDDGRAYDVVAPVYLRMGRAYDAARAYSEALRLLGETPERLALYGEALVYAANGAVTSEAQKAFEAAAAEKPGLAKAQFFLGLAAEQDGDVPRAREIWDRLIAGSPPEAPWVEALRQRSAALAQQAPNRPQAANSRPFEPGERVAPTGPAARPEMAARIQAMPEAERSGAIRGMVDKLASRLAQNGQDVEGWLRLVRAYSVLNETAKARAAVLDAKRNLAADAGALDRIDALARELGIES